MLNVDGSKLLACVLVAGGVEGVVVSDAMVLFGVFGS